MIILHVRVSVTEKVQTLLIGEDIFYLEGRLKLDDKCLVKMQPFCPRNPISKNLCSEVIEEGKMFDHSK